MASARKVPKKDLVFTIEYRVSVDDLNLEDVLQTLRERGSADVTDVRIVDSDA